MPHGTYATSVRATNSVARSRHAACGRIGQKALDIALDSGFGDVSNFNRAFRSEFGMSPTVYRKSLEARA